MLGKTLGGRYRVVSHLGGGGFGHTFLAEDCHLPGQPKCVVKQLKLQIDDADALQAAMRLFDREAEALYALGKHDQIPQLFAHFEEHQQFYLVQEFVEGQVLSQQIKRNQPYSEAQLVEFLQDILPVLGFVHQNQVIHRDIKPSNLIRRRSDHKIVLIDFGAVKQISTRTSLDADRETTFTIAVGSSGYMPNEQLAGRPSYSSDLYAIGMVAIQLLTGMPPGNLGYDPRTGEILWRDRVDVSPLLADAIDDMVRYDYRQRYQSVDEVLQVLQTLSAPNHDTVILPTVQSGIRRQQRNSDPVTAPLAINLNGYLAWLERGDELFQQRRYEKAIECYDKVLQVAANNELVWFKRGIALENLRRYEEAINAYAQVIHIHPQDYLAWSKLGKVLEHLKRYDKALAAYNRVVEIQPDNYWAWHDRGSVLERSEHLEDAVEAFDRAVQLKPDFSLAVESRKRVLGRLRRVDQLYHLQHYAEAIESCDRELRENPHNALAWLMRGMAMENLKQYTAAANSYMRVVKLQPEDQLAWLKLGNLLEQMRQYPQAASAYTKVIKLQPDNQWGWHDRGRVMEKMLKYELALAAYERALRINPDFQAAIEGRQRSLNLLKRSQSLRPSMT